MQLLLRGIYIHNDLFYIHVSLSNSSNVNFDIDHIRFRIADRKVAKRTALQETFVEPVRAYNAIAAVKAGETLRNVYVFRSSPSRMIKCLSWMYSKRTAAVTSRL